MNDTSLIVNNHTYKESNGVIYRNNEEIAQGFDSLTFDFKNEILTINLQPEGVEQSSDIVTTKLFIGEGVTVEDLE
ncbi:hypothetical protein [Exiguobacterium sp. s154]|uniref:hypothetical protein n=1 Tax=Exiguobacterium sp. s154 TaxID=2751277 RepID=UPI002036D959|nr:hypothetical protein [Exiguobacterium sp. s154]